jgi:hypothetical protein
VGFRSRVSASDKAAALEDLRTAHRILIATAPNDERRWSEWLLRILLVDWILLALSGDFGSPGRRDESEIATARDHVRAAFACVDAQPPSALDDASAPRLATIVVDLFRSIRSSDPALLAVPPLDGDPS